MSLNSNQPLQSMLATNLVQLKKLSEEDTAERTAEVSSILLWIAENHPDVFEGNAKELQGVYVSRLNFHKSWEFPDELVPTNFLKTLLHIYDIKGICGYMDHCVLEHLNKKMLGKIRLALGKHINVRLLIEELNCRRIRHLRKQYILELNCRRIRHLRKQYIKEQQEDDIAIHLRCGELDLEDLDQLPNSEPYLYISDVSDQDVPWVVQAAFALRPKPAPKHLEYHHMDFPYFGSLKLPRSNLTPAGVEAIVKGLCDVHVFTEEIQVSSPHLDEEIPGYEYQSDFCDMLSDKYNIECIVNFADDKIMEFTEFPYYNPDDSSVKFVYGYGTYESSF